MDRRKWCLGLMVMACSMLLMAGTASAHGSASAQGTEGSTCAVHSLPSFVAQGEFSLQATAADVIEVECNPFLYGTGSKVTVIASQLYSRCNSDITWYIPNPYEEQYGRSVELTLDADGNATVALIAGPKCQAGESLVSVHQDEGEFNSYTTSFTVLPPNDTPLGVTALPSHQVEDAESSAVATIIEAEFPGAAESYVRIGSEELYRRCGVYPHLHWITPREEEGVTQTTDGSEFNGLQLDNNGNGFVIAIGDASCSPGTSLIEADLEEKPFTTVTTNFTVESPKPTEF
jgi:hypothetical protein